jgi:hypothetical protein
MMGQTPGRRYTLLIVALVAAVLVVLCGVGVVALAMNMGPTAEPFVVGSASKAPQIQTTPNTDPIVLEVTTTGKGNVSWNYNGQGGTDNGVTFPYRKALGPFDSSAVFISMVVQDTTGKGGPLQAKITYGEKVWPCEGSGAYAVVTCSGSG